MRRSVLIVPLLVLATAALGELAGWRFLRGPAEGFLSRRLERPIRIEAPFRLHLLGSVRLRAGTLWIAAPEGFEQAHLLAARDISLKLRYGDLLDFRKSGNLRLADIDVDSLDARLVRRQDGRSTWEFGHAGGAEKHPPPAIDHFKVGNGKVAFADPAMRADLLATFSTRESGGDAAPAAQAEVSGRFRGRPLKARLQTSGWLPAGGQGDTARPVALNGELDYGGVRASFNGGITDLFGERKIRGTATVEGASLGLVGDLIDKPLPTTAPFFLRGQIDKNGIWRVAIAEARIGKSRLSARLSFDPDADPARLDGDLSGELLALVDLAPAFGSRDASGRPLAPPPGRLIPDRELDLPALKKLDARIRVDLARVDLGQAFAVPIAPFRASLDLSGGRLGLAEIDARTARGRLSGTISVDARADLPAWQADLAWDDIRLEEWVKPPAGRAAGTPPYFSGTLHGGARLAGKGRSTAALLGSLDGDARLFVRRGSLSHLVVELLGLDVAQGLGLALGGDDSLPVRCAVVDLEARDGRLRPRVGLIDTPVTLIVADGSIDLGSERLDLRLAARPKNVSPFTLRSPIRVRGSFSDPQAAPEGGPIAARLLGGAALALINPLAAIIPFIDPGEGDASPCARSLAELRAKTPASPAGGNFRR